FPNGLSSLRKRSVSQEQRRVNPHVVEVDAPVQMRSRHTASLSHLADLLAGLHPRARLDVDSVHVAVQGDQAMPVVQNDGVAIEEIIACCSHHTGCRDRKSTRLNSSHVKISYAVFCLKKKKV